MMFFSTWLEDESCVGEFVAYRMRVIHRLYYLDDAIFAKRSEIDELMIAYNESEKKAN